MNDFFVIDNPPQTAMVWTIGLFMLIVLYVWLRKETGGKVKKSDAFAVAAIIGIMVVPLLMGAIVALAITGLVMLYTLLFNLFK